MSGIDSQLQAFIEDLFFHDELNQLPESFGSAKIFRPPLFGVSAGDDPIFRRWPEVIGPRTLAPLEMWTASGFEPPASAGNLRVLTVVFPYSDAIREPSKQAFEMPADIYSLGRNWANAFKNQVQAKAVEWLTGQGYQAHAPNKSKAFMIIPDEARGTIYSTWSERHMAFAAGLGSFSLHEGFISEAGCNIRLASVMTDAPLGVTPRPNDEPYRNCLYMNGLKCMKCAQRCPGENALTEKGHDKLQCWLYGQKVEKVMSQRLKGLLKDHYRNIDGQDHWSHPVGCAFCQFDTPCMDKNPMAKKQAKEKQQ